jgi:aminoglycoside 2'-N-acetyltransferase I
MTAARRIWTASTEQLSTERFAEINDVCESAFRFPFAAIWDRVGQGLHVVAEVDGRLVAHAMLVDRRIYTGAELDTALDAAYVENVATRPDQQGRGHGSAVMHEAARIIGEEYEIGALATRDQPFYLRMGWVVWEGPTFVRTPDGERVRTAGADGEVMVLRTSRTPPRVGASDPIAVDWRAGEPW